MTTYDLTRDQLVYLKESYLCETRLRVSYSELADADNIVSDAALHDYYKGVTFTPDDFPC